MSLGGNRPSVRAAVHVTRDEIDTQLTVHARGSMRAMMTESFVSGSAQSVQVGEKVPQLVVRSLEGLHLGVFEEVRGAAHEGL